MTAENKFEYNIVMTYNIFLGSETVNVVSQIVLRIRSTQKPQYSTIAVLNTTVLKNLSTHNPQYSKTAVLKI